MYLGPISLRQQKKTLVRLALTDIESLFHFLHLKAKPNTMSELNEHERVT